MKICRNCGTKLIVKQTRKTPQRLKKPYYYSAYYFCPNCKKLYHNDAFKVVTHPIDLFTKHAFDHAPADVEIWTDGACVHNGTENAKAAWAFVSGDFEKSGLVKGKQTNNTAEAFAIYHALLWAAEKGYKKIRVHSDSQITLGNLQKYYELVKENQAIFQLIHDVITANSLEVAYKKVLGHAGDPNNERADKLANNLAGIK